MTFNDTIRNNMDEEIINAERVVVPVQIVEATVVSDSEDLIVAESVRPDSASRPAVRHRVASWIRRVPHFVCAFFGWTFGFCSMIIGLAILATIPVLQFLSLGYLIEASGRVARSGRVRDGFIGIDRFARVGSIVLGTTLAFMPVWFISSLTESSIILNGPSRETRFMGILFSFASVATVCHIVWAWFRGGRLRHFIWPAPLRLLKQLRKGGWLIEARDATCEFIENLRLPFYFMLGLRGFAGAILWLFIPVTLLSLGTVDVQPVGAIVGLIGSFTTAIVVMYLPFMQTRFALENDFGEFLKISAVRDDFRRAPVAFWIALFCTLLFALPLYLLKAELVPREAAWLPSLVFVVFMFPSRLAAGWAIGRAAKRTSPRHGVFRWSSRFSTIPVLGIYVGFVFLTQYVSWYGRWSLYEQHAFLLPVPFLGMW